jgi:hypothetical protein
MTSSDRNVDEFIDALRSDLPSEEHERRSRARLVAAGIVAGTGVALPGAAGAASAGTKAGLLSKLAGWSWGAKLGLAGAVIAVAALPIANQLAKSEGGGSPTRVGATQTMARSNGERRRAPAPPVVSAAPRASTPAPTPARALERKRSGPQVARPAAVPSGDASSVGGPNVGSLPEIEAPATVRGPREGTLREEAEVIARALAALRSGDRSTALYWLAEHARRFPDGRLRQERERARERANETGTK